MDRYGAFSRQFNSKYDDSYNCHSSDTKSDYDYGYPRRDDYDTDSELEYGENSFHAPPLRRAPELRSRFDEAYTDRTSENEPRGKREMSRLPEAGYDGRRSYDASSLDGESEYERYGRDASRGM